MASPNWGFTMVMDIGPTANISSIGEEVFANTTDYACHHIAGSGNETIVMSYTIYIYAAAFFVIIGLVGNALSVMVFSSKEMRTVSSNFYLLTLAISDSLYLVSIFMTKILTNLRCLYFPESVMDIFNRSDFLCKLLQYFLDLFSDYSTCLILAFTVERYIAVYMPLKFKELCTVKRARIACSLIFIVTAVLIAPYHFLFIDRVYGLDVCAVTPEDEAMFTILYVVEILFFRIGPVFLIAGLNVFIIVRVSKLTRERKRMKEQGKSSQTAAVSALNKKRARKEDKSMQLTIMLILVSTSYILVYLPVLCHYVIWRLARSLITVPHDALQIAQVYTSILYIFGFSINFFLYTMSGRVFREQLDFILCDRRYHGNSTTQEMTTLV